MSSSSRSCPGRWSAAGRTTPRRAELVPNPNCKRLARSQGELFTDAILATSSAVVWADGPNLKMESATGNGTFDSVAMSDNSRSSRASR